MAVVFVTDASAVMITPVFLIFLQDRFTTEVGALVMAIIPAALISGYLPSRFGELSDRLGRTQLMALGLVGSGIVSFLLPSVPSILFLSLLWALESIGWTIAGPAEEAMIADLTGYQVRGRGYGLYTFAASLGATIGPLIGGWLYDSVGQAVPFYLNGIVLLIGAALVFLLLRQNSVESAKTSSKIEASIFEKSTD